MRPASTSAHSAAQNGVTLLEMDETSTLTPTTPTSTAAWTAAASVTPPTVSRAAAANAGCDGSVCAVVVAESSEPVLREAQQRWAARSLTDRLQPFRAARHWIAAHPQAFTGAISPALARSEADTLVAEVLPLLDALRFLERNAHRVLSPRRLGSGGRPLWLAGVDSVVHRDPLGHILLLGPANFPIFLPGVQAAQALVAGNAVTWKPGAGGRPVALLLNHILREAGLPRGVLHITGESNEAGQAAIGNSPDKVFLTGSVATGKHVLSALAETVTPATMELSGADAAVVLPSADLAATAKAIAFGLRLNGAEVCMSPRRLVGTAETLQALGPLLRAELDLVRAVALKPPTAERLHDLLTDALGKGATIVGAYDPAAQRPLLIEQATPAMAITHSDIFAPVLSLLVAPSVLHVAEIVNKSSLGLAAAIFGDPREASILARELRVGTVQINDLIAPTADPRIPFGGRGQSGFGVTRGAEGLLEMTAPKVIVRRRRISTRHYEPLGPRDLSLLAGLIGFLHGGSAGERWQALRNALKAARKRSAA